jgi:uncharacterized alkaline shock family protein YloU
MTDAVSAASTTSTRTSRLETTTPTGTTTVAPRVVEKLAARAAAGVPGAHEVTIAGLPSLLAPLHRTTSTADADMGGDAIGLVLHIEAEWPAPLESVARRAREEVRATVLDLVGLDVGSVEVRIERFAVAQPRPRPRVR